MKKIISIAVLTALFWMPSPAQFLGPPNAYTRTTADTLSDTSLFIVQVPSYGGSNTIKVRSITLGQLTEAVGADSNSIGAVIHDSLTAGTGRWSASRLDLDTLNAGVLVVDDTSTVYDSVVVDSALFVTYATASTDAVFDANKKVVSNAVTGTGNSVRSASPTFTGTVTGAALDLSGIQTFTVGGALGNAYSISRATPGLYFRGGGVAVLQDSNGHNEVQVNNAVNAIRFFNWSGADAERTFTLSYAGDTVHVPFVGLGTAQINGAVTLSSTLAVTGNVAVNTNKFNVTASSGKFVSADTGVAVRFRATSGIFDSVQSPRFSLGSSGFFNQADVNEAQYTGDRFLFNSAIVATEQAGVGNRLAGFRSDGTMFDTSFVLTVGLDSAAASALISDSLTSGSGVWSADSIDANSINATTTYTQSIEMPSASISQPDSDDILITATETTISGLGGGGNRYVCVTDSGLLFTKTTATCEAGP